MTRSPTTNGFWFAVAGWLFVLLLAASLAAPESLSTPVLANARLLPWQAPPFGTDDRGVSLLEYALQGARIVALPSMVSGLVVAVLAMLAGFARCADVGWFDTALQVFSEMIGALPRLVVVLVVALALPLDWRGLMPIGLVWALMAAPGAMDEAATTAGRLGGARFVEALRAHGFSAPRIYGYHITWLNLRSVLVRQGAEVMMQVVFLEIALSYLAQASNYPAMTHSDAQFSWARLLYMGYTTIAAGFGLFEDGAMTHAMVLGLVLVTLVAVLTHALRMAARPR